MCKRIITKVIATFCLMCFYTIAHAEDVCYLVFNQNDATEVVFALARKPQIQVSGNSINVIADEGDLSSLMSDIDNFHFTDHVKTNGVEQVNTEKTCFDVGNALVKGLKPGSAVFVYAANGMTVCRANATSDGTAQLNFSNLEHGVYIIKTPGATYKFRK